MDIKQLGGSLAVALAVFLGLLAAKPHITVPVTIPPVETQRESFGAVPTLDGVDNPYVRINGAEYYYYSKPIAATSSVFCSVLNPFAPATTSIVSLTTAIFSDTISAASTYDVATGTSAFQGTATSSPALIRAHSVGAGVKDSLTWSPRQSTTTSANILGGVLVIPDTADPEYPYFLTGTQRLNWQIATGTPGTDYYGGRCSALFRKY